RKIRLNYFGTMKTSPHISYRSPAEAGKPYGCCVDLEVFLGQCVHTHSRRQTSSLALPHQPSQPPRYDQYEISGLKIL
ncbi:MAG: hypothetical protein K9M81_00710, partial [Chthoniobacterales bacterium]|nr:hypothetical protein [Chthoniobacterales bacterium]